MERQPIRLLIADDNLEICDILEHFFELTDEVTVCGVAHDGEETLFLIAQHRPDVVLLDLIMPKTDGLSVLEQLMHMDMPAKPRVIVASAVGQEGFTRAALERGADYYMIKPYDLTDLLSRVCLVASLARTDSAPSPSTSPAHHVTVTTGDTNAAIAKTVLDLGFSPHMRGYQYTVAAVAMLLRENRPCSIVKEVYAGLALEYGTTTECVEAAIRKALRQAWCVEPSPLRAFVGGEGGADQPPPANGRFLTGLAQHIRLEPTGNGR